MRRPATALALALLAGAALVGCRTSPSVAAYIGDETITADELDRAVEERLADPVIAEAVGNDTAEYRRQVLTWLVNREVFAAAAERYDVVVDESDVLDRISDLLGGNDPQEAFTSLAAEGFSREDVLSNVAQQLVAERIAVAAGEAEEPDEAALAAQYDELLTSQDARPLGIITVADQATADSLVAALRADPSDYAGLAAENPGRATLPAIDALSPAQLPPALATAVLAAPAGSVFSQPIPELGGVAVVFVPTFDDVVFALGQAPRAAAQEAGAPLVQAVGEDLDVDVNPRFGSYTEGSVVPAESAVVEVLESDGEQDGPVLLPTGDGS